MAWWRLETNGHSDLGDIIAWRAIAEALERKLGDTRESLDRLASSFPAFVEAERCDELALRRYGIRVSRIAEPPATVRPRPEALVRLENAWAPLRASIESLARAAL